MNSTCARQTEHGMELKPAGCGGVQVVALANLLPDDDSVDELDSYMYQTVGHQLVAAYAECMGLPLFRRRLRGSARLQELRYRPTVGDEVEDLTALVQGVLRRLPGGVEAVCSGAIASDYQRLRVESVCARLHLVSLAPLWRLGRTVGDLAWSCSNPQIDAGVAAILVKVASLGLHPDKHLGRTLTEVQGQLLELADLYGSNVCGEGGEYETLTLDCPLFKHGKIVLDSYEIARHSLDAFAPVGVLHPTAFHVERKAHRAVQDVESDSRAYRESYAESYSAVDRGTHWVEEVEDQGAGDDDGPQDKCSKEVAVAELADSFECAVTTSDSGLISVTSWQTRGVPLGAAEELVGTLLAIGKQLSTRGLDWDDALYVHLYLASMSDFAAMNAAYARCITEAGCPRGVPSRTTVEARLRRGAAVQADVLAAARSPMVEKKVLHVQSISSWAPACIGPYSQATLHGGLLHMAGQLGLEPATMTLVSGGAAAQTRRALRSCEAVAASFGSRLRRDCVALTVYCSSVCSVGERVEIGLEVRTFMMVNDEDTLDDHDQQEVAVATAAVAKANSVAAAPCSPLVEYVIVPGLPKGAAVELAPLLYLPPPLDEYAELPLPELRMMSSHTVSTFGVEELCCQSVFMKGRLCRAHALIALGRPAKDSDVAREEAAKGAVESLGVELAEAGLWWGDVAELRVYETRGGPSQAVIESALAMNATDLIDLELKAAVDVGGSTTRKRPHCVQPVVVPVDGVGPSPSAGCMAVFELLAVRWPSW
eukprot:SM000002S05779  [mRNA]  locus=s2:2203672:2208664:+ [translate_table: standard]